MSDILKKFKARKIRKNAGVTYLDEETGFNEFIEDQFAVAIRKILNMDVIQTADHQFVGM